MAHERKRRSTSGRLIVALAIAFIVIAATIAFPEGATCRGSTPTAVGANQTSR